MRVAAWCVLGTFTYNQLLKPSWLGGSFSLIASCSWSGVYNHSMSHHACNTWSQRKAVAEKINEVTYDAAFTLEAIAFDDGEAALAMR